MSIYDMVFTSITVFCIVWILSKKFATKDYYYAITVSDGVCAGVAVSSIIINGFNIRDVFFSIIFVCSCIFYYCKYQNCNWKW